jgi:metal-responsive CopG/Arc/MetJ family transcriptional regulator
MRTETVREPKTKVVLTSVTASMLAALDALAERRGMSRAAAIRWAVREVIKADGGEIA